MFFKKCDQLVAKGNVVLNSIKFKFKGKLYEKGESSDFGLIEIKKAKISNFYVKFRDQEFSDMRGFIEYVKADQKIKTHSESEEENRRQINRKATNSILDGIKDENNCLIF